MKKLIFVYLLALTALVPLQAADLVTVIVADTTDPSIGLSTAIDFRKIRDETQKIARYTGLKVKEITVKGKDVTPQLMLSKLDDLQVSEDDVVLFYFSGHGYRTQDKEGNPWPNLYFSRVGQGVDFNYVADKLKEKNPRLLLLLADVCNSFIDNETAPQLIFKAFSFSKEQEILKANYRSLFLETRGTVMIASSEAGEYSWATAQGGLFTVAFLQELGKAVKSTEYPNWDLILGESYEKVSHSQHPLWDIATVVE